MSVELKEGKYTSKDVKLQGKSKRWFNPLDLEEYTGWSRSWQSKARMSSSKVQLPHKKIGKFVIYDKYEIDAFIEEHTVVGG